MENKYDSVLPWPCENMVFRWISVFWVHTETVMSIVHSNIVRTFIVHCVRQSVSCSHLSLSLNKMETKYGTVCTYETVLMSSSDNKAFQSVTFQTSTLFFNFITCFCLFAYIFVTVIVCKYIVTVNLCHFFCNFPYSASGITLV
jgi:hypothetical protein